MITHDLHYRHPKLNWDLITQAREDSTRRLEAMAHIRSITGLNIAEVKLFLDNHSLYFDPREGDRELTDQEKLHSLNKEVRRMHKALKESALKIAMLEAERDVYKSQYQELLRILTKENDYSC